MRVQAARACVVADYSNVFREIDPPWDRALAREADESPSSFYAESMRKKAEAAGVKYESCYYRGKEEEYIEPWKFFTVKKGYVDPQVYDFLCAGQDRLRCN